MLKRISALVIVFLMVLSALPVNAAIVTDEGLLPFTDVRSGWYLPAVEFCYVNRIMSGKSETCFDPKGLTTREQMMTVLCMLSPDDTVYPQCSFTDVGASSWYTPYVNMAVAKGYTSGISDTLFGVGKTLTRQETVTLMYNFARANGKQCPTEGDLSVFADTADTADWALDAFSWAVREGIIAGANGKLNPRNPITRGELAQIMFTFTEKELYDCEHSYTEESCTESAVCTLCGLIKGMPLGHSYPILNCSVGSDCERCGKHIVPEGHKFAGADCTKPMTCSVCGASSGTALGHTTDCGICARCGIEVFKDNYSRFVYYMTQRGMTDSSDLNVKYLMANVKHTDGNTSTQYVKYNTITRRTTFEIIYKFVDKEHYVRTVITMDLGPGSSYYVESYYSMNSDLTRYPFYGSGRITASDNSFVLNSYHGDSSYRKQFESVVKGTLLLNLDASNTLIKEFTGISMADFGFTAFK